MPLSIGPGISIGGGINFLQEGTYTGPTSVEYLVVAGGGSGGLAGGGGGAGGYRTASGFAITPGTPITVTVGAGASYPSDGNNSVFDTITSIGGGRGGIGSVNGNNGGSGGGAGHSPNVSYVGGKGVYPGSSYLSQTRQGYDGGNTRTGSPYGQGGGGGASEAGGSPIGSVSGLGGNGASSSITGSAITYAGGGGGGGWAGGLTAGSGGTGGGGTGSTADLQTATSGSVNTGGGGGGGSKHWQQDTDPMMASQSSGVSTRGHPAT